MLDNIDLGSLFAFCLFVIVTLAIISHFIILPWLDEREARRIVAQGNAEADRQSELRRQREAGQEGAGR